MRFTVNGNELIDHERGPDGEPIMHSTDPVKLDDLADALNTIEALKSEGHSPATLATLEVLAEETRRAHVEQHVIAYGDRARDVHRSAVPREFS